MLGSGMAVRRIRREDRGRREDRKKNRKRRKNREGEGGDSEKSREGGKRGLGGRAGAKGERGGNSSSELAVSRDRVCRGRRKLQDMRRDGACRDAGCRTPGSERGELDQCVVCVPRGGSGWTEAQPRWNDDGREEKYPTCQWLGIHVYKNVSDRNVTIVQPEDKNFMGRTASTRSNIFLVHFLRVKNDYSRM